MVIFISISDEAKSIQEHVVEPIVETNDDPSIEKSSAGENGDKECQDSANNNRNRNDCEKMNFTLDALENTKIAVAQFATAALSKGPNENSAKDLTMLQSALFTLQHQQVFQMQLIERLQYQLAKTATKTDKKREIHSHVNLGEGEQEGQKDDEIVDEVFMGDLEKG